MVLNQLCSIFPFRIHCKRGQLSFGVARVGLAGQPSLGISVFHWGLRCEGCGSNQLNNTSLTCSPPTVSRYDVLIPPGSTHLSFHVSSTLLPHLDRLFTPLTNWVLFSDTKTSSFFMNFWWPVLYLDNLRQWEELSSPISSCWRNSFTLAFVAVINWILNWTDYPKLLNTCEVGVLGNQIISNTHGNSSNLGIFLHQLQLVV